MSKADRKQAVRAEIERRAKQSGVPEDHYVYEMSCHHCDEGGPRPFVPVKIAQMIGTDDDDDTLWPSMLRAASNKSKPIELAPDDSRIFQNGRTPLADLCSWDSGDDRLLILTERANQVLEPVMRVACRPVAVSCATQRLFGYRLKASKDVLDVRGSKAVWIVKGEICSWMEKYAFHTSRLGPEQIFCIPQNSDQLLALQPFVDLVRQHALTGFTYKRVWPHSSVKKKIVIEAKKLPRAAANRRSWPTYSVDARKIAPDLLKASVKWPLTDRDGKPADLAVYRLPDLSLPTGAIVAADLIFSEARPFVRRVPPGKYPLELVAATKYREEHIALAIIRFADKPVVRWEVAEVEQPASKNRKKRVSKGYGVDSGTGGFCDAAAQEALHELADPEKTLEDRVLKEMAKSYRHTRSWVHLETPKGSAAIFSSGYGDGTYQSYFGLDQSGAPVMLLTDFGVVNWR